MLLNFICIEKGLLHCRFWWMHHLIVMHNSLLTVEKNTKTKQQYSQQNKTIQTIKHFSLSSWNSVSCVWAYYGMSCLQLHLLCLLCRRLLSAGHRHLSLWLRTKLLGNCTISHLSFLFSFLANGLLFFSVLSFEGDTVYMPNVLYESDHWALEKIS